MWAAAKTVCRWEKQFAGGETVCRWEQLKFTHVWQLNALVLRLRFGRAKTARPEIGRARVVRLELGRASLARRPGHQLRHALKDYYVWFFMYMPWMFLCVAAWLVHGTFMFYLWLHTFLWMFYGCFIHVYPYIWYCMQEVIGIVDLHRENHSSSIDLYMEINKIYIMS